MHSRGIPNARAFRSGRLMVVLIAILATILGTAVPAFATPAPVAATSAPTARGAVGGPVQASLAGFSAGNIISDAVFTDKSTMTEAQIQAFFNSKVTTCQGGSDQYGPIICLKDYKTNSVNRPADKYCPGGYAGAANESAARIIYRVAQACNINPRVLIVMLQKEQSLVTHTWPSAWRYDKALGQGCPDDAACNPAYVGFFYQIYGAARQMQIYMDGVYFTWYAPGKTWNILYNPNRGCGTSPVYVANKATSALYYYTPYQPNAAALRAGYGSGDGCSSYGNRNFYNYFTDWFGSTQTSGPVTPPPPTPTLSSIDRSDFVGAVDAAGVLWGYPFGRSIWGDRVKLASGLQASGRLLGVGDLDGDGFRDLVVLDRKTSSAVMLRGNGAMGFGTTVNLSGDWSGIVLATAAGDVNSDGAPDVFTTDAAGRLLLRAGDDRGGLRTPVQVGQGWAGFDMITGGIDMNGDGVPDLLARDASGALFLYPGTGRAAFAPRIQIGSGWSGMTRIFSPGDFTGGGRADILATAADGTIYLYRNIGSTGAVEFVGPIGSGWQTMTTVSGVGDAVTRPRVATAGVGDINASGGNDVLALTAEGRAFVYGGDGSGSWTGSTLIGQWAAQGRVVALGDFSGDGRRDIARIDSSGALLLYRGNGSGGFAAPTRIGTSWGGFLQIIGGLDFDGDRKPDVLAISKDGRLWLYRGNGRGGWVSATGQQVGQGWDPFQDVFYAGDLKSDGSSNLLARLPDGRLFAYPISRTGKWGTSRQVGNGWQVMKDVFSPGDFNGDGNPDLLAVTPAGDMYLYPGDGRGSWTARKQVGSGWQTMTQIR